jgi:hypothetical protein
MFNLKRISGCRDHGGLRSRRRFSALLTCNSGGLVVPDLSGTVCRQILAMHMAALVAVDAHQRDTTPSAEPHALSAYLLTRDERL